MNTVDIEFFSDGYKTGVGLMINRIQKDEFGIPITLDQQPDLEHIDTFYQSGKGNFWIAKVNGLLAGSIGLLDIGNNQAALRKMFVEKEYRGNEFGVAEKLLATLTAWCKEKMVDTIYLGTTEKFLRAQRFYEKHGFTEIDKEELPASFPVMEVDVKFYKYNVIQ